MGSSEQGQSKTALPGHLSTFISAINPERKSSSSN
jgi:hypothetical protein